MEFNLLSIQGNNLGLSLFRFSNKPMISYLSLLSFSYSNGHKFLNRSLLSYHHSLIDGFHFFSVLFFTFQVKSRVDSIDIENMFIESRSTKQADAMLQCSTCKKVLDTDEVYEVESDLIK